VQTPSYCYRRAFQVKAVSFPGPRQEAGQAKGLAGGRGLCRPAASAVEFDLEPAKPLAAAEVSKAGETTALQDGWFGSVSHLMHLGLELTGRFLDKKQKRKQKQKRGH